MTRKRNEQTKKRRRANDPSKLMRKNEELEFVLLWRQRNSRRNKRTSDRKLRSASRQLEQDLPKGQRSSKRKQERRSSGVDRLKIRRRKFAEFSLIWIGVPVMA